MTRDATLDAFASSEGDRDADDDIDEGAADGEGEDEDVAGTEMEDDAGPETFPQPVVATTDWTPGGAPCAACGATVERRWHQDGSLVCPACKNWNEG